MRRRVQYQLWVAALGVVAVVALGVSVHLRSPGAEPPGGATNRPSSPVPLLVNARPVGPIGERHGVPVGWPHHRQGAEEAAVAFVESSGLVAKAGPLTRRDVILTIATPDYGPVLVEQTNRDLDDLLFALGERGLVPADLVWSEHALTMSSHQESVDRAVVRVWSVLVIGAQDGPGARQMWRTSTIELAWTDGDWKVERWSTEPGPLPAPPPEADASTLAEVSEVVSWRSPRGGAS